MPIYSVEAPNGKIYDVEAPEGTSERAILSFAQNAYLNDIPQEPTPEYKPEPATGISSFIPSVKRGALGLQSLVGDVLPAMAGRVGEKIGIQGAGDYATRQMQEAQEAQQYIQQMYPSAVPSYKDIKGGGDLLTYVVESVGELIPSILPSIFTGGAAGIAGRGAVIAAEQAAKKAATDAAKRELMKDSVQAAIKSGAYGGQKETLDAIKTIALEAGVKAGREAAQKTALKYQAVGAVGGSALQNVPEVYQNIAEETGKEDLGAALLFGGFNSVLDAITPIALLRKAKGIGLTEKELIGAWYKRAGKGALTGFATEGATEAVQEMSSAAAEKFVDENKNFFTEKNFERFINAGLKGGIGGGVISGAANIPFGQEKPPAPVTPIEPSAVAPTATTEAAPAEGKLSAEEIIAKAEGKTKKAEEETIDVKGGQDVTDRTDTTGGGVGAEVLGGPTATGTPTEVAASERPGVVDVGGTTEQAGAGDAEQQRTLTDEEQAIIAEEAASALAGEVIDPKIVATKLSEANKTRRATNTKPTEVINKVIEDNKDIKIEPRRTATQERAIQLAQIYRQQQAALAAEIEADETLSKAERDSAIAFQNYMLVGNNNIKNALNILSADLFDGSSFNSNQYMPNIGGKYAELFYESLNPTNKKFVDERVQFLKDQDKRLSRFRGEAKDKAKEETKAYEESLDVKFSKKELKKIDKFNKEAIERNKALLAEDKAGLEAADEAYGGTTPKLISSLLRGDLRGALQEIASGPADQFSQLDKMVARRLLQSKTLPALEVVPESQIGGKYGQYEASTDVASIGENHMNGHTVLHETLHGFTLAIIKAQKDGLINNPGVRVMTSDDL